MQNYCFTKYLSMGIKLTIIYANFFNSCSKVKNIYAFSYFYIQNSLWQLYMQYVYTCIQKNYVQTNLYICNIFLYMLFFYLYYKKKWCSTLSNLFQNFSIFIQNNKYICNILLIHIKTTQKYVQYVLYILRFCRILFQLKKL